MTTIHTTVDIDLNDFDETEIAQHFMDEQIYVNLSEDQVLEICHYHEIEIEGSEEDTIRDEQYQEVFALLKEKFSVAELEAICNSK